SQPDAQPETQPTARPDARSNAQPNAQPNTQPNTASEPADDLMRERPRRFGPRRRRSNDPGNSQAAVPRGRGDSGKRVCPTGHTSPKVQIPALLGMKLSGADDRGGNGQPLAPGPGGTGRGSDPLRRSR